MIVNYSGILKPNINWYNGVSSGRSIGWFSGGAASAVACYLALQELDDVFLAFTDTHIESDDTYRFLSDFEGALGVKVHHFCSDKFNEPEDVWREYNGLNFAHGAPCSTYLKREVRIKQVQDLDNDYCQIFGFDFSKREINRAINMVKNHAETNPRFPLIEREYDRGKIFSTLKYLGIKPPIAYIHFDNNNCLGPESSPKGGCVQGGVGYWQKMREVYPHKFDYMANIEHELSKEKGEPVTICKDQREATKGSKLFLKFNPGFPDVGTIDEIKGRQPDGYFECNGFCGTLDMFDNELEF
ncbi:MAG: hypothetical protein CL946_04725 [Ectothiorhodospiraceae bacterium]|jgi:hypothetical protein|nr:hypothetical protein [Ectothiorhodospiraceae bacterium]